MAKGKFSSPGLRGQNEKEFLTGKFRVPRPRRKSRFNLLQQNTKIILDEIPRIYRRRRKQTENVLVIETE